MHTKNYGKPKKNTCLLLLTCQYAHLLCCWAVPMRSLLNYLFVLLFWSFFQVQWVHRCSGVLVVGIWRKGILHSIIMTRGGPGHVTNQISPPGKPLSPVTKYMTKYWSNIDQIYQHINGICQKLWNTCRKKPGASFCQNQKNNVKRSRVGH